MSQNEIKQLVSDTVQQNLDSNYATLFPNAY